MDEESNIQKLDELEGVRDVQSGNLVMDLQGAAEYLSISTAFLYKLVERRQIPFCKIGKKRVVFRKPDLYNWLGTLVVNPDSEIGDLD